MAMFEHANSDALDAANYFLTLAEEAGEPIDPMTLQKLVFYAQCWSLYDGKKLFDEPVQAWRYGPVVKDVWKAYSGDEPIKSGGSARYFELDNEAREIIQAVWQTLKGHDGPTLSRLTHEPGSAWTITRTGLPTDANSDREISLGRMRDEAERIHNKVECELAKCWDDMIKYQ